MKIESTFKIKKGLAEMLKGGVIMDVVNAEQAVIAEKSGAVAVMALERIPADIRAEGGSKNVFSWNNSRSNRFSINTSYG